MRLGTLFFAATLLLPCAAFSSTIVYFAALSGANESPANASPGIGSAFVTIDDIANTMIVDVSFSGLTSGNTASHIHCCTAAAGAGTAGVATITPTFTGFPSGTIAGTYDHTFDLTSSSSYNPAFVTANGGTIAAAEQALLTGMAAGKTYLNIHTTNNPGGEIRGFLVATPEPATLSLGLLAMAGLGFSAIRRKRVS